MIISSKVVIIYSLLFLLLTLPIYYNTYYYIYDYGSDTSYVSGSTLWLCSIITANTIFLLILGLSINIDENRNNRHRLLNDIL